MPGPQVVSAVAVSKALKQAHPEIPIVWGGNFGSLYPAPVLDWIERNGGLTPKMKIVKNGPDLWAMLLPCPEEW